MNKKLRWWSICSLLASGLIFSFAMASRAQDVSHPTIRAFSRLEPTLNWDNDSATRRVWERLQNEHRIRFDETTGNYVITYVTQDGLTKKWTLEPANKMQVDVDVHVTYDEKTGLYRYAYIAKNGADSKQSLHLFGVEYIESEIHPPIVPQENVEKEGHRFFFSTYQYRNTAVWAEKVPGILPGKQSGEWFYLESPQPPGVVKCYAQGYVPSPRFASEKEAPGDDSNPHPFALSGNCVVGLTIGPMRPRDEKLPQTKDVALSVTPVQEGYWLIQKDMEATVTIKNIGQQEEQIISTEPRYDYRLAVFRADGTPLSPRTIKVGNEEGIGQHNLLTGRRLDQKIAPGGEINEVIRLADWFTFDKEGTYTLIVTRRLWAWDAGFVVSSPVTIKVAK